MNDIKQTYASFASEMGFYLIKYIHFIYPFIMRKDEPIKNTALKAKFMYK